MSGLIFRIQDSGFREVCFGFFPDLCKTPRPSLHAPVTHRHPGARQWGAAALMTTSLPLSEWTAVIPSARLCKALLDRMTDRAHFAENDMDSYRYDLLGELGYGLGCGSLAILLTFCARPRKKFSRRRGEPGVRPQGLGDHKDRPYADVLRRSI